ncbi:MAG: TetR/AcrR family transcriptional regulator [Clostridiales Family XIII bacterium]|jgi:AcrR family transcriptional regulator|nr:TetR/AcrR family transcriptional regulator [Clostridiales Family XIII bacterium]
MNGFEKRTQEKRNGILRAAVALFSERGIQKGSVAEIAAGAGVSQVTIYKYFESKENLARCALEQYYNGLLRSFIDVIDSARPFAEKVEQAFFAPLKTQSAGAAAFWDDAISEKFRDITLEYEQKLAPHMMRFIEQGYECGHFDKSYSVETLLLYLNVFGVNAMKQLGTLEAGGKKKQIYEEFLSLFFYGVAGKGPK